MHVGVYGDDTAPDIILISPSELLAAKDLEVTQENLFTIYAYSAQLAEEMGLELILIGADNAPSTKELIEAELLVPFDNAVTVSEWDGEERRKFPR
ncbi:hypothetical protein LCGC14_0949150 [marine sediment metagenome]|uniref:Uncharacterized protein n=1 Tax=marine sediment metagenome TaxID=412755 RepID=A0A0F9P3W9_9ZZZZ